MTNPHTTAAGVRIGPTLPDYADQVPAIYQAGIDTGHATFETQAPTWTEFDAAKLPAHRLLALDPDSRVLGR
ncbi:hypothetical protein ACWDLG_21285 [Nonomuraea sp. NPDC003727]